MERQAISEYYSNDPARQANSPPSRQPKPNDNPIKLGDKKPLASLKEEVTAKSTTDLLKVAVSSIAQKEKKNFSGRRNTEVAQSMFLPSQQETPMKSYETTGKASPTYSGRMSPTNKDRPMTSIRHSQNII